MTEIKIGERYKTIYFIGIGGINMSGLAELLFSEGYNVSGSDQTDSYATKKLRAIGIPVFIGHMKRNIKDDIDLVVYTAAVKDDNVELTEARAKNIHVCERAELLGLIMKNYKYPVCVSGTHGKTSTTSMLSEIFMAAGKAPTLMIGGILPSINSAMKKGGTEYFIAESCEYHDSFLKFCPYTGIILNIEKDHTDYFGTLENIRRSFRKFAELIPDDGTLVINSEISNIEEIVKGLPCTVVTYGSEGADWVYENVSFDENGHGAFDAVYKGKKLGRIKLNAPGVHNIGNALAATAAAYDLGISFDIIAGALCVFSGAKRRFQHKGTANGFCIVDDYAHHPTEIKATLASAKNCRYNNLWCVFQPHTKQRTQELFVEFSESFDDADKIVILDIFSPAGREDNDLIIHSEELAEKIRQRGKEVYYFSTFPEAEQFLLKNCLHNDLLITMGAGDVYKVGEAIISACN